ISIEKVEDGVADEEAHTARTKVRARAPPRRVRAKVIVEVDAAIVWRRSATRAVELPQVQVGGPVMVVDDVHHDGDPTAVRLVDELHEALRRSIGGFRRVEIRRIVAP